MRSSVVDIRHKLWLRVRNHYNERYPRAECQRAQERRAVRDVIRLPNTLTRVSRHTCVAYVRARSAVMRELYWPVFYRALNGQFEQLVYVLRVRTACVRMCAHVCFQPASQHILRELSAMRRMCVCVHSSA